MLRQVIGGDRATPRSPAPAIENLVSAWAAALARPVYRPMSHVELHRFTRWAALRLAGAAAVRPVDTRCAHDVGAALVDTDLLDRDDLPATVSALTAHLPAVAAERGAPSPDVAARDVTAAVVAGYVARMRARILDEQETVRQAEVQARKQTQDALLSSEARFRAIFENSGIGIGIADMDGRIVDANEAFASMLGYTVEEFCRINVADFVYPDDAQGMWELYAEIIEGKREQARVEKRYRHRDGRMVWTDLTASLIRDAQGDPLYTVAMAEDATTRHELQDRLRHQALHDPLTGLPNRTMVNERLAELFSRPGGRIGVCYLDVDNFKIVNDRLGHGIGDKLLVAISARLHQCVAERGHLVGRMGGDEFVILVQDPPPGEVALVADLVLASLASPVDVDEHRLVVTASIGVVETDVDDTTPAEVLKAADVTLYWAKSDGRARWAQYDPERAALDMTRFTLTATLAAGLERDEFEVEYQPIVRLDDGAVAGVEALVRWDHPTLGRLGPDRFIEVAEETGAIVPLGRHVLREACRRAARWNAENPGADLFVSVNLAVRQAHDPALVSDVADILADTGLPPHLLQLELTESALLGPAGRPVDAIGALADLGIRIAVDDFGTGYSNLGYLPRLPLHSLKLAGVLVEGLRSPTAGASRIVTSLVALAHALGLTVTGEGVETPAQAARLRTAGCDTAQGWLYARPAPWDAVVAALGRTRPRR
ncbi:diguanylate cyclase/phosphodiesterase with PAS/PAC sensor(s) [Pseudonocardia dioxanivorans CB1190]|uniref:Diguanylate cyclase/phosphodiesterase with PAS/PAC sensor(S) n=1 Tax=Pseudonocardia dioxanivorans (strain ATCC 55486 / DSM 44775 / JCM 13855 / CB1190) TaxID=675635 RepID=F4CRN6_PSEUX|nr:diguanylate cyclase/phosphodiesterase with PAS/PAC sensor(s) [Pseudonocardia dioxanivorans CB1190]